MILEKVRNQLFKDQLEEAANFKAIEHIVDEFSKNKKFVVKIKKDTVKFYSNNGWRKNTYLFSLKPTANGIVFSKACFNDPKWGVFGNEFVTESLEDRIVDYLVQVARNNGGFIP